MWSWSHTNEAYAAVARNLQNRSHSWLTIVWAEWQVAQADTERESWDEPEWNDEVYNKALEQAEDIPRGILADEIYDLASEQADCTNGGWQAYVCPFHCHEVAFDKDCPWIIDIY